MFDDVVGKRLSQAFLCFRQAIERHARIGMVGRVLHDVVDHPIDRSGKPDVRRTENLPLVERPFIQVVEPGNARGWVWCK